MSLPNRPPYRLTALLPVLVFLIGGCQDNALSPSQEHDAAKIAIGRRASMAASLHVDAVRACKIAGVKEVDKCSRLSGTLMPEREAKASATFSMSQTERYFKTGLAKFTVTYCNELIARAIEMELRRPVSPVAERE